MNFASSKCFVLSLSILPFLTVLPSGVHHMPNKTRPLNGTSLIFSLFLSLFMCTADWTRASPSSPFARFARVCSHAVVYQDILPRDCIHVPRRAHCNGIRGVVARSIAFSVSTGCASVLLCVFACQCIHNHFETKFTKSFFFLELFSFVL